MNIFDGFKLTIFELVGYILPGLFFQFIFYTFFSELGIESFISNLTLSLVLAYPLGQFLHSSSNILDYDIKSLGWSIYHKLKERDQYGHGVKEPTSKLGRLAKKLRYFIESHSKKNKSNTNKILREKMDLDDFDNFDLFFLKESILAKSDSIATNFQHLHYQKIFNRSLAFTFILLFFIILSSNFFGITEINITSEIKIDIQQHTLVLLLFSIVFYRIFYGRAKFFKSYRDKILNSATRLYLQSELKK